MIAVVDYGMGNIGSILNMVKKAGGEAAAARTLSEIAAAPKVILPGVGAFDAGVRSLKERGLWEPLARKALEEKVPFLGICLGMQLMTRESEEGTLPGLGWLKARTVRFKAEAGFKIPHMGWNTAALKGPSPLFKEMESDASFYFVHSYHLACDDASDVAAVTKYGLEFPSMVRRENLFAVQFHPEKSRRHGLRLIRNFVEL